MCVHRPFAGLCAGCAPVLRRSFASRAPVVCRSCRVGRCSVARRCVHRSVCRLVACRGLRLLAAGRVAGPVVRPVVWPVVRPAVWSVVRPAVWPARLLAVAPAVRRTFAGRPSAVRQPVCRPCVGRESVRGAGRSPAVSRSLLPVARRPVSDIRRPFAGCAPVVRRVSVFLLSVA